MISKFVTLGALALTLAAALPAAAADVAPNERPDTFEFITHDVQKKSVTAGSIHSRKELSRLGLKPHEVISITLLPSSGGVDRPSRGDL